MNSFFIKGGFFKSKYQKEKKKKFIKHATKNKIIAENTVNFNDI
jgi:hypothetical protein